VLSKDPDGDGAALDLGGADERGRAASTRALAAEWRFERTSDEVESLLREVLNPGG
jgi:hypothetical protein